MLKSYVKKIDILIYVTCTLVAMSSILSMNYFELTDSDTQVSLEKLGFVVDQRNITKRKQMDSLAWKKVYNNHSLFSGDKVFTEERSLATLGVGKKSQIDLSELTLMRVDKQKNDSLEFDFIDGFFVARVSEEDKIDKVVVGDTVILPMAGEDSTFQVLNKDGKKSVSVIDGNLILNQNGNLFELKENQQASVDEGSDNVKIKTSLFKLISPKINEKLFLTDSDKVKFRWVSNNKLKPGSASLVLSNDREFKNIVLTKPVMNNFLDLDLQWESNSYFWKIITIDTETKTSEDQSFIQRFDIDVLKAPIITSPLQSRDIYLNEGEPLKISWSSDNDTATFDYKLMLNNNGEAVSVKQDKTTKNFVSSQISLYGQYFFQVRSIKEDKMSSWSKPFHLNVKRKKKAFSATMLTPVDSYRHIISDEPVSFTWQGSDDAEYFIELAKDKNFKKRILLQSSYNKKYNYTPTSAGRIYWRILDSKDAVTDKFREIICEHEVPSLLAPLEKQFLTAENTFKINVSWSSKSKAQFILQVSQVRDFSELENQVKTNDTSVELDLVSGKKYFLRVGHLNSDKYSLIKEVEIKKLNKLQVPKLKNNFKFKIKQTFRVKKIGPYSFKFSELFADSSSVKTNFSSFVDLEWDQMTEAKEYEVEIYQDSKREELITKKKVASPVYRWKNPKVGTFYWRIRYFDEFERSSDFSNISKIVIEKEMIKKVKKATIPYFKQIFPSHNYKTLKDTISLRWQSLKKAKNYRVLLYSDFDRNKLLKKTTVKTNTIDLKLPRKSFYWKIEALDSNKQLIAKTRARKIILIEKEVPPILDLSKKENNKKKKQSKKDEKVKKIVKKRNSFLDRKKNPNMHSFVLGGIKPGTYSLSTDLEGSLASSSDNLILLASFDIYAGFNYSQDLYFEGFYDYKTAGNSDLTIFDHTYGAIAYKYFVSEKKKNILYGLGGRHSIFNTEIQQESADSSVSLNYFNIIGKILVDIPLLIFEQRISLEAGFGLIAPLSYYYQLSYHAKYYYFKKMGLTPLEDIFIFFGGEYLSRTINYQDSTIEINNLLGVAGAGIDIAF